MDKLTIELLSEVEALCALYLAKDAEGEPWGETCKRLVRLDALARKIRAAERRRAAKAKD